MYIVEVTNYPLAGMLRQLPHCHRPLSTHRPCGDIPPLSTEAKLEASIVWLSTTTFTSRRTHRRLRTPVLRSMRNSLRWLPSMAKHERKESILHLRAKKYLWSIHKCDHGSLLSRSLCPPQLGCDECILTPSRAMKALGAEPNTVDKVLTIKLNKQDIVEIQAPDGVDTQGAVEPVHGPRYPVVN